MDSKSKIGHQKEILKVLKVSSTSFKPMLVLSLKSFKHSEAFFSLGFDFFFEGGAALKINYFNLQAKLH